MTLYGLCANATYPESRLSVAQAVRYGVRMTRTIVYGSDESRAAVIANARELQAAGVESLVVVTTETTGHVVDDLDAWARWIDAFLTEAQGAVHAIEPGNELDSTGWTTSTGEPITDELIIAIGRRAAEVCRRHGVLCTSPSLLTGPEEGRFEAVARGLVGYADAMACFVPEQEVSALRPTAASVRYYEGDIVTIETSGGQKVTCTPNHPILTRHGWLPAAELNEGTQIVYDGGRYRSGSRSTNHIEVPTRIADLFRSLNGMHSQIPGLPLDFHGDGSYRNINRIETNFALLDSISKSVDDIGFVHSAPGPITLPRFQRQFRHALTLARTLKSSALSIGVASWNESPTPKHHIQSTVLDAQRLSDGYDRLPIHMSFPDGVNVLRRNSARPRTLGTQAVLSKQAVDASGRYTETFADVLSRLSGDISVVDVLRVSRRPFSGHVYNLTTDDSIILADGIVTHNCHPYYCSAGGVPNRPETRSSYPPELRQDRWRFGKIEEKAAVCERLGHGVPTWFTETGCPVGFDGITPQEQALWSYALRRFQHPSIEVVMQFCLTDAMVPQAEIDEQKRWGITDERGEKVSALMLAGYSAPAEPPKQREEPQTMPTQYTVGQGVLDAMRANGDEPGSDECYYPVGAKQSQWSECMGKSGTIYRYLFATNQTYRFPPDPA